MKYFLTILLFISFSASAQFKAINFNKVLIRYDSTLIDEVPELQGNAQWVLLKLKSNGDTLAILYYNGNVWTKANVVAGSITAPFGTSTVIQIALPATVHATNRYFMNDQMVYQYSVDSHIMPDLFNDVSLKSVIRISDSKTVANFFGNGFIWHVMPAAPTLLAQGIAKVIFP